MSTWVIGGTSGIGAAIVTEIQSLNAMWQESDEEYSQWGKVYPTGEKVDVCDYDALEAHLNKIVADCGEDTLDTVFYCAGINNLQWLGKMGADGCSEQLSVIEVNLFGFIQTMDILANFWERGLIGTPEDGFRVVAISSDAAQRPLRTSIGYCASKAGLDMAIRVAARELGPKNWSVVGLSPGMTDSGNMTNYINKRVPEVRGWLPAEALEYERSQEVVKGRIPVRDVAVLALELGTGPKHLNGSIVTMNGGR